MTQSPTRLESLQQVPTLSLRKYSGPVSSLFADQLYASFAEFGFVVIKDHNIDTELLSYAYELSEKLFALPEVIKRGYISPAGAGQRGYTPFGQEHAKDSSVMDLKEFWHVGPDLDQTSRYYEKYPKNIWPHEIADFKTVFQKIFTDLSNMGRILLKALTVNLGVAPDYFEPMVHDGTSILRLLHYPPIAPGTDPNCLRAAPHEDINLITLLVSATASGLQIKTKDGHWLDVESEPQTLIVNIGDMLSRMTGDIVPSTTHQVVNIETGRSRYSMPFFLHPHPEAVLTRIPKFRGQGVMYPDITAHDFLMERLREIGLADLNPRY